MKYKITKDDSDNLYLERTIDEYNIHLKNNLINNKVIYPVLEEDLWDIQEAIDDYFSVE
jgi:hypothetical protein